MFAENALSCPSYDCESRHRSISLSPNSAANRISVRDAVIIMDLCEALVARLRLRTFGFKPAHSKITDYLDSCRGEYQITSLNLGAYTVLSFMFEQYS